jgi:hypothetical protein
MLTGLRFAAKCSDRELADVTYPARKIWRNRVQSRNFQYGRHAAALAGRSLWTLEDQAGVGAAKSERIRQNEFDLALARLVWHEIDFCCNR